MGFQARRRTYPVAHMSEPSSLHDVTRKGKGRTKSKGGNRNSRYVPDIAVPAVFDQLLVCAGSGGLSDCVGGREGGNELSNLSLPT